jgi:type IV secretory pathway ATPase VirB11/archaellum biosynthesis ATPase
MQRQTLSTIHQAKPINIIMYEHPKFTARNAKTLPIQVAAISKTPINTRSPHVRVIIPSGSHVQNVGLMAGCLKTPFLLGFRDITGKGG